MQGKWTVKLNRKREYVGHKACFGRFMMSKGMSNYLLSWLSEKRQKWQLFQRQINHYNTKWTDFYLIKAFCMFLWYVFCFVSLVKQSTGGHHKDWTQSSEQNNSSRFNLCRTKPSSLYLLPTAPSSYRCHYSKSLPLPVNSCNSVYHVIVVSQSRTILSSTSIE